MKFSLKQVFNRGATKSSHLSQLPDVTKTRKCAGFGWPKCARVRVPSLTRQQWLTIITVAGIHLASSMSGSLHAPFFPQEAESKGATATEYGLVFAIFQLVMFVASPVFGKYTDKMGAKKTINIFILVVALSCIAFGFLHYIEDRVTFISLCFVVRTVQACGAAAVATASLAVIAAAFPESVTTTISALETFYGLGYFLGPTIGGYLFEVGGYICPFAVMGCFLIANGVMVFFILPDSVRDTMNRKPPVKIFSVMKIPAVILDALCLSAASLGAGFYVAILEPHVREFQLSPVATGFLFVISGGTYAIMSPLAGRLCDTLVHPRSLIIFGGVCIVVGFCLVGPLPFLPVDTVLWMVCVGLFIHGLGFAFVLAPAYTDVLRTAVAHGFPEDMTTYGLVSGLWISSLSMGSFVGPALAGILYDFVGFRQGTLLVIVLVGAVTLAMVIFVCTGKDSSRNSVTDTNQDTTNMTTTNFKDTSNLTTLSVEDLMNSDNAQGRPTNMIKNCVLSVSNSDIKGDTNLTTRISPIADEKVNNNHC